MMITIASELAYRVLNYQRGDNTFIRHKSKPRIQRTFKKDTIKIWKNQPHWKKKIG